MSNAHHDLDPMIRSKQLKSATGLSRATVYRLMQRGDFPRPIQLSPGAVGWPASTIRQWRATRANSGQKG
jgi:prophage regulatory protein